MSGSIDHFPIPLQRIEYSSYESARPGGKWLNIYLNLAGLGITSKDCNRGKINEQNPVCMLCSGLSGNCVRSAETILNPRGNLLGSRTGEPGKATIKFPMRDVQIYRHWISLDPTRFISPCGADPQIIDDVLRLNLLHQEPGTVNLGEKLRSLEV
jgi:hypothetical protein